ncbi:hypothetical protein [Pseudomonas alkylphenolica]|uniref:hypothetical protein n=1 Tax=Pseudomonas alkylphenolica TaxID=237609 RepID=UPI0018D9ED2E|nr:hypothetical protein [Pseudomonas alkylphenolica]MBH3427275.1 hypothetical protein [Pseudomonas alkylphenolica]
MLKHDYDRSFVAYVACTTPGHEGYLDFAKLAVRNTEAARIADDWLIVTSFLGREPHRFWFRCLVDEATGRSYYDVQSWSRRTGRDFKSKKRHMDRNHNGYACLYEASTAEDRLWKVMTLSEGSYARMSQFPEVGQSIAAQIWARTSNDALCVCEREDVGDEWFAYVATSGGPTLNLRLEITDIGEELLDDH